jgi:hypothetical protein
MKDILNSSYISEEMGVQWNIPKKYSAYVKYFRRNESITEYSKKIFCILQIFQKKWEYNETFRKYILHSSDISEEMGVQ